MQFCFRKRAPYRDWSIRRSTSDIQLVVYIFSCSLRRQCQPGNGQVSDTVSQSLCWASQCVSKSLLTSSSEEDRKLSLSRHRFLIMSFGILSRLFILTISRGHRYSSTFGFPATSTRNSRVSWPWGEGWLEGCELGFGDWFPCTPEVSYVAAKMLSYCFRLVL